MVLAKFIVRHRVFAPVHPDTINAVLDAAALELNETELAGFYDEAHGLLTAHKLCLTPEGRNARMMASEHGSTTTYEKEFNAVMARAITPLSVTGGLNPVGGCT